MSSETALLNNYQYRQANTTKGKWGAKRRRSSDISPHHKLSQGTLYYNVKKPQSHRYKSSESTILYEQSHGSKKGLSWSRNWQHLSMLTERDKKKRQHRTKCKLCERKKRMLIACSSGLWKHREWGEWRRSITGNHPAAWVCERTLGIIKKESLKLNLKSREGGWTQTRSQFKRKGIWQHEALTVTFAHGSHF